MLLQIAIFGTIMTAGSWPPSWFQSDRLYTAFITFSVWELIHIYIRWQLRQRRESAYLSATVRVLLTRWINNPPEEQCLQPYERTHQKKDGRLRKWLAKNTNRFLFPLKRAEITSDEEKKLYPQALIDEWDNQVKTAPDPIWVERLITLGSALMLFLILFRTFYIIDP